MEKPKCSSIWDKFYFVISRMKYYVAVKNKKGTLLFIIKKNFQGLLTF